MPCFILQEEREFTRSYPTVLELAVGTQNAQRAGEALAESIIAYVTDGVIKMNYVKGKEQGNFPVCCGGRRLQKVKMCFLQRACGELLTEVPDASLDYTLVASSK